MQRWHEHPDYALYRQAQATKETTISLKIDAITFSGVIDLLGPDFVLDYKTDQTIEPRLHRCQLWVYAAATQSPQAHIAYLRKPMLYTYRPNYFQTIGEEVQQAVKKILQGDYRSHSWPSNCQICPYAEICDDAYQESKDNLLGDDLPF